MKRNWIVGIAGAMLATALAAPQGYTAAKPIKLKGSGSNTFVTANFTYDGAAQATQLIGSGKDNFGGTFSFSSLVELSKNGAACTTSSGSTGVQYDLVESDGVNSYAKGQIYYTTFGVTQAAVVDCVDSTGFFSGAVNYSIYNGTNSYAAASGTATVTFSGQTTAAGSSGLFGAESFTSSGSVTK